jgi:ubiquinone/menaquinone biosynthesis C-methylase UbiE
VGLITVDEVQRCLAPHLPLYAWHKPSYQTVALNDLRKLWRSTDRRALDVGGGTGVLAYAIKTLFGLEHVASVDVHDRFLSSLNIETAIYDGINLPFGDNSFDCVLLLNVLHHVPVNQRVALLRECRRVAGRGSLYIKDHLSRGPIDSGRLAVLDLLGNAPFAGMVSARYLREAEWQDLALKAGYRAEAQLAGEYRNGLFGALFPNRLEISMRWHAL